ncbi:MAG: GNAT family N-acetyltransferase [Bacteroidia bacterium]
MQTAKTFLYSLEGEESERLLFRKLTDNDRVHWMEFCSSPDSLKYVFPANDQHYTPEESCKIWFDKVNHRYSNNLGGMNALIHKTTGEFIGQCGLLIQTIDDIEELEIGYSMMPQHRNHGYASEAARKCRDFAFANAFRESLISVIHIENISSQKVAEHNGMTREKQTQSKGDPVYIYRITRGEWEELQQISISSLK